MSIFTSRPSGTAPIASTERVLGIAGYAAVFLAIVAPRTLAVLVPVIALGVIAFTIHDRRPVTLFQRPKSLSAAVSLLMAYAAASTAWSAEPLHGLPHVFEACAYCISAMLACAAIERQPLAHARTLCLGAVLAFALGLAWVGLEVISNQAFKSFVLEHIPLLRPRVIDKHYSLDEGGLVSLDASDLDRNIAVLNLLFWPILYGVTALSSGRGRSIAIAALLTAMTLVTFCSQHKTSKLALAAAVLLFAATWLAPKITTKAMAFAWLVAVLGVCPITWVAYDTLRLQDASFVPPTGRERISIWADIATRTVEAPVFGAGARTTNLLNERGTQSLTLPPSYERGRTWLIGRHPHNVYLQVWFELGAVGALLFAAAGLLALQSLGKTPTALPYAYAAAGVMIIELGFCWDIWQRWFIALLALTAMALAVMLRFERCRRPALQSFARNCA